jgi:hypothetical protein
LYIYDNLYTIVKVKKTGLNWSFIGPRISQIVKNRRLDRGCGLNRSITFFGPDRLRSSPVPVFCRSQDWTSKHYSHCHPGKPINSVVSQAYYIVSQSFFLNEHGTGIKPFYLHMQAEDQAHLCPVRALAEWIKVSCIKEGYLFRRIWSGDHVADLDKNTPMVSLNELLLLVMRSCLSPP